MKECSGHLAKLDLPKSGGGAQSPSSAQTYTDTLSNLAANGGAKLLYAVEVLNPYGRSAGLSNQAEVSAAPTLPAPADLRIQLNGEGVQVIWTASDIPQVAALRFLYRIYRREADANSTVVAGEVPVDAATAPAFLDSAIEWEKTYTYRVAVVTLTPEPTGPEQQVEGDDTSAVTIVAHDVFPPAIPEGLEAAFSGPGQKVFIDLVWTPDTDADLAGYNVYRAESGAELKKLNTDLVKSPAFRDGAVSPGHKYSYSVSAVDARGNESARSQSSEEAVPAK
jgi:hypothetical protein